MIGKGMPKPSVLGALAQNTVWYSLLTVLAVAVIFGVSDERFWQLPSAYAVSDPAYDSTNSGTAAPRSFARGISESLAVTSTFGSPAAPPQSFTRTISDSVGVTSSFAPPQSAVARTTTDNTPYRSSQYYPGPGQRTEERLNLKNLANTKTDAINDKGYIGGTPYLNLEALIAPTNGSDSSGDEIDGSSDASDPDDSSALCILGLCIDSASSGLLSTKQALAISSGAIIGVMLIPVASSGGAARPLAIVVFRWVRAPGRITDKRQIQAILLLVALFLAIPSQILVPQAHATVSYVGVGTAGIRTGDGTISGTEGLTLPSGLQAGDVMVVFAHATTTSGTASVSISSGWTQIVHSPGTNGGLIAAWYRAWQSGDSAPTLTFSGLTSSGNPGNRDVATAQVAAWRGLDTSSILDQTGTVSRNTAATNIGPISGITLGSNDLVIVLGAKRATTWTSVATLSGDSLTWNEIAEVTNSNNINNGIVWDYAIDGGSGTSVTNKTFTVTGGTSQTGVGIMFSLNVSQAQSFSRSPADSTTITDSAARAVHFSRSISDSTTITDSAARQQVVSKSISDSTTISDSAARTLGAFRSISDALTLSDNIRMSVTRDIADTVTLSDTSTTSLIASRSISDSTTISDSISTRVSRSLSDTFTVTDSVTANKSFSRSISDSLIVTDSAGRSYVTSRTAADTVAVADSISTTVSRSISDSTTISDSIVGTKAFTRSISETLTTTDSAARTLLALRSAADTVAVTDSVAISGAFARSTTDTITVTDSIAAGKHFDRSISDSTAITDSISAAVSRDLADSISIADIISATLAASRSVSDSTTLTDSVSISTSRSIADLVTIGDSATAGKHFSRSLADSTTVTDSAARTYLSSRAAADTVTITDSISPHINHFISDSVTLSDSLTAGKSFNRSLSDAVTVTDGIVMSVTRDISDTVILSDSMGKSLVSSRSASDSLSITDTLAHGVSRSTSDTFSITEAITAQKAFGRPMSDSISITDTPAATLAPSRSTSDSVAISDVITTTFHVARSISDAVTLEDTVTAGKHFDRSVADSATVTDSIAKAIIRSITDSVTLSDNIVISITISRALSDSLFITDAIAHGVSRATSDTLSVTDAIDAEKAFGKPVSDSISVTDNAATTLEASRSTSDSVAVSDAITTAYLAARSISDTVTTEVQVTAGKSFTREIADTIETTDSPATTLSATRTISDTATLSDSTVRQVVLSMSVSETVSVTANVVAGILFERTLSDSFTVTEAISITTGVARSTAESLTIADNITFELGPNRSMAETIVITDSIARSVIASRSPSDTLVVEDIIGDHFNRDVSDTLAIGVTVDVVVHVPVVEVDDTVNVNAQLSVSVNRSLTFDESLTLGECTPFACNQVINLYETPAQFLTDELRIGRIDVDIEDGLTVSDSITAGNLFEKQVSDTLVASDRLETSMGATPPSVPSEWNLAEMPRIGVASDTSLVQPALAPSLSGTFDTTSGVAGIVSQTGMPMYDTSSIFTATDMTDKTLVLPMFRVAVEYTDPLPTNNGMITPVISSIPANTAISVPVDIDATTMAALGVGHPIKWVDLEFTPGVDATNFALMINMLENEPAGATLIPNDKTRFYLDVRFDGDFPLDVSGNPIDPSTEGYYANPPTFTFAITDEWADENNAERDADGVPIFSISLLDETTGEWEDLGGITFVSEEDGAYTYTVSLEHFSTYAVTANEVTAPTGGGGRAHASFTVPLADSLQTIDATKGVAIEVIEEFGGQKFRVSLSDLLAISVRPVAYQTFSVSENVQVSIGLAGITEEGILPQTAKATFLVQVDNFGPTYETFRLDFWYYDQSGDRAYESSQEIAIGPFETRELTMQVPFSSAGTFAVVAEARSVPEGNLINTAQFTVNIPWLSIYLYSLLSVAAAIIGASAAVVAILLIKRNVQTPSVLAVPLRRLAGAASVLSIIRKSGASNAIAAKIDSVARSLKNIRDIQAAEPEKDVGTDGLSVSANWANAFHGSLLAGEYTAIIDFDAVNQSKNQIFLMRYWAVDMAEEVVYSYSETMTLDSDKPKSWRMHVELPASGEYVFHMEAKFARDGKVASSAQLVIKVP